MGAAMDFKVSVDSSVDIIWLFAAVAADKYPKWDEGWEEMNWMVENKWVEFLECGAGLEKRVAAGYSFMLWNFEWDKFMWRA